MRRPCPYRRDRGALQWRGNAGAPRSVSARGKGSGRREERVRTRNFRRLHVPLEGERTARAAGQRALHSQRKRAKRMKPKNPLPAFASDDEEQTFLDSADLTEYDLETGFKPFGEWLSEIEMKRKDARV